MTGPTRTSLVLRLRDAAAWADFAAVYAPAVYADQGRVGPSELSTSAKKP
jgi:hypothetical protein